MIVILPMVLCGSLCADGLATVATSAIAAEPDGDGGLEIQLSWPAFEGARYGIQFSEQLGDDGTGWETLDQIVADDGEMSVKMQVGDLDRGFFRLTLPQPEISAIEPAVVLPGGGIHVVGQCFEATDAVYVDGVQAVTTFIDHTTLLVAVPEGITGTPSLEVRNGSGTPVATVIGGLEITSTPWSDVLPPEPAPTSEDPDTGTYRVAPSSGELMGSSLDLQVPGVGLDVAWRRTYRSKTGPASGPLGPGWDHSYNVQAVKHPDGSVTVSDGNGRSYTYSDPDADGKFTAHGLFREGSLNGQTFSLRHSNGLVWAFNAFNAATAPGSISSVTDRNGNQIIFSYDASHRLDFLTDTLGRTLDLAYDGSDRITSVTDHAGRTVTYHYANGLLESVTSPPVTGTSTGNDFPTGRTVNYAYTDGSISPAGRLETVTDAKGQTWLELTYDPSINPADFDYARVTTVRSPHGDGLNRIKMMNYDASLPLPSNRFATTVTTLTDGNGNVSRLAFNSRNLPVQIEEFTGRVAPGTIVTDPATKLGDKMRPGDPDSYVTTIAYNSDSLPTRIESQRGDVLALTYESDLDPACEPEERGNVRVAKSYAAPGVPTDHPVVTERFEYLEDFGAEEGNAAPSLTITITNNPPVANDDTATVHWGRTGGSRVIQTDTPLAASGDNISSSSNPFYIKIQPRGYRVPVESAVLAGADADWKVVAMGLGSDLRLAPGSGSSGGGGNTFWCGNSDHFRVVHTDPRGYVTTWDLDEKGNCLAIHPPEEGTGTTFEYDSMGRLTAMIHPDNGSGHQRRDEFAYHTEGNGLGLLDSVTIDAGGGGSIIRGNVIYNTYGYPSRIDYPTGGAETFEVNALGELVSAQVVDASDAVIADATYQYDANGNLIRMAVVNRNETGTVVPANPSFVSTFGYDALNRLTSVTEEIDASTTRTTQFEYDHNDNLTRILSPEAVAGNDPFNTVDFFYDERDLLFRETFALGDPTDRSSHTFAYDANGALVAYTEAADSGAPQTWTFAPDGQKAFRHDPVQVARYLTWKSNYELLMGQWGGKTENTEIPWSGTTHVGSSRNTGGGGYIGFRGQPLSFPRGPMFDNRIKPDVVAPGYMSEMHPPAGPLSGGNDAAIIPMSPHDHCWVLGNTFVDIASRISGGGHYTQQIWATTKMGCAVITDPNGNVTEYDYDAAGNLRAARTLGELDDQPGDANNVLLSEIAHTYDANGRPRTTTVSVFDPASGEPIGDGQDRTLFTYTPAGALATITDDNGNTTTYTYDSVGRTEVITATSDNDGVPAQVTFTYLPSGLLGGITKSDGFGGATSTFATTYVHDDLGRVTSISDSAGNVSVFGYDSRHNLVVTVDGRGNPTRMVYDGLSRPLFIYTDMAGDGATGQGDDLVKGFAYDLNDRLMAEISTEAHVTGYAYDSLDRVEGIILPDGQIETITYRPGFASSLPDTVTDAKGSAFAYDYDALDRVTQVNVIPGTDVDGQTGTLTYSYDGLGRLVSAVKQNTMGTPVANNTFTYRSGKIHPVWTVKYSGILSPDHRGGGLVSETQQVTVPGPGGMLLPVTSTVGYAYDEMGLLTSMTYPSGEVVSYTYDGLNRVATVSSATHGPLVGYDYVGIDLVGQATNGNCTVESFFYNGDVNDANAAGDQGFRQVARQTLTRIADNTVLEEIDYAYDANGNLTRIERDSAVNAVDEIEAYGYDAANRLSLSTVHQGGLMVVGETYVLDDSGLRDQVDGTNPGGRFAVLGEYGSLNADGLRDRYTSSPFGTYAYDNNGNRTGLNDTGTVSTYRYDALDNLVGYHQGATSFGYSYDALGRRVVKFEGSNPALSVAQTFVYAGGTEIAVQGSSGDAIEHLVSGPGWVSAATGIGGTTVRFIATDTNGSALLAVDDSGGTLEAYDYHVFGMPAIYNAAGTLLAASAVDQAFLWQGRRWDAETQFYLMDGCTTCSHRGLNHWGDRIRSVICDPKTGTVLQGGGTLTVAHRTDIGRHGRFSAPNRSIPVWKF